MIFIYSISGQWSNEAVGELLVGNADTWPNPSKNAQPSPGRNWSAQWSKVWITLLGTLGSAIHVGCLRRIDQQIKRFEIRQRWLCLPQVCSSPQSRLVLFLSYFCYFKSILMQSGFFSDVRTLRNRGHVQDCHDQVRRTLHEYCINCYQSVPVSPLHLAVNYSINN